jgi:hypothetical protein
VEADPVSQPEGFDAGSHLPGGAVQGEPVGIELGVDGELARAGQVEEGDPGQIHEGPPPKAEDPVQRTAQVAEGEEIELTPQLDKHAHTGLPHCNAVQVFTFLWVAGFPAHCW